MQQTHSLILWAQPRNEDFRHTAERAYALLALLKEFGPELNPLYLTVGKKSNAKPLEGTYNVLENILQRKVNREGKTSFSDLGYTISFFSSMDNKSSAGISFNVGVTNPKFKNTFIVNLPMNLQIGNPIIIEKIKVLFKNWVEAFEPFWGCIRNNNNWQRYDSLWKDSKPTAIHWMNYFDKELVQKFDKDWQKAPIKVDTSTNGLFVLLKEEPINDKNPMDIELQQKVNTHYGL